MPNLDIMKLTANTDKLTRHHDSDTYELMQLVLAREKN